MATDRVALAQVKAQVLASLDNVALAVATAGDPRTRALTIPVLMTRLHARFGVATHGALFQNLLLLDVPISSDQSIDAYVLVHTNVHRFSVIAWSGDPATVEVHQITPWCADSPISKIPD